MNLAFFLYFLFSFSFFPRNCRWILNWAVRQYLSLLPPGGHVNYSRSKLFTLYCFLSFCEGWWNWYLQHLQRSICRWKLQNEAFCTRSSVHGMYVDQCSDVGDTVESGKNLITLTSSQLRCLLGIVLFKTIGLSRLN